MNVKEALSATLEESQVVFGEPCARCHGSRVERVQLADTVRCHYCRGDAILMTYCFHCKATGSVDWSLRACVCRNGMQPGNPFSVLVTNRMMAECIQAAVVARDAGNYVAMNDALDWGAAYLLQAANAIAAAAAEDPNSGQYIAALAERLAVARGAEPAAMPSNTSAITEAELREYLGEPDAPAK